MTYRGTIHDINRERERAGLPAFATSIRAATPLAPTYLMPAELPIGQRMALLRLRGGPLANQLLAHASEWGGQTTDDDERALAKSNYAMWHNGEWQLTPSGLSAAQAISADLARKLGIHAITRRRGLGNRGPSITCVCGFYTYSSNMNGNGLERYAAEHLQQAASNTLPPAYRRSVTQM